MPTVDEVTLYIAENVLHSKLYDNCTPEVKIKVVNQAKSTLFRYMPDVYRDTENLPVEDVAEQVLWLLKMDDTMQRAEMGALMITVDGVQIQMKDMDRTIAPKLMALYGKTTLRRAKVGMYSKGSHYRVGQKYPPSYYNGYRSGY